MKRNELILSLLFLLLSVRLVAQNYDTLSINKNSFKYEYDLKLKNTILPVVLVGYGIVGFDNPHLKSWNLGIRSEVLEHINTKYRADDYFQYAPGLAVYILDDAGLKAKHSFWDRTAVLAGSFVLQTAVVQTLKYTTNVTRPDSSAANSFPSGHTTLAFLVQNFYGRNIKTIPFGLEFQGMLLPAQLVLQG
ncbi:hypothetical protein [Tenuifilum sp.]|uniref:hypothetical protein n=1 Tax=Tenuifilum sp. TaxID=2760880 RepID=UPI002589813E|nr:hypothetical protein [Tenuifilum sp.]